MGTPASTKREFRLRWWTLAVVAISVINVVFDTTIVNIALPTFQQALGTTQSELQWIVNSYMIIFGSLMLITGALGDRWGRARMLQAGLVAYAGASIAAALSTTGGQLILWRSVMGIGGAMVLPATLAIITSVFPREEHGRAIGIWAGINGIGVALGPILAGVIIENLDWNWVFLINVPLAVVAVIAGGFLVPNSRDPNPRSLDILGAVLSAGSLATLIFGLIRGGQDGWADPTVLGALAVAVVLMALFILWQRRAPHPLVETEFFRRPRFSMGIGAVCLMALAMMGINFTLTLYMQFVQGYTPWETGLRFVPVALGLFMGAGLADRVVARVGTTAVVVAGFLGLAAVSALAVLCRIDTPYWQLGLIVFGWGYFLGCVAAPATDAVMGALPKARAGIGSAMNLVGRMVAGAIGVAVLVSALSTIYSSSFENAAAVLPLPEEVIALASDSVGVAVSIAGRLPPAVATELLRIARESFMDGWQAMVLAVCGISLIGAVLTLKFMPRWDEPEPGEELGTGGHAA